METKKPFHEVVAEKLIEQLKAGTAPWQRPWEPGEPNAYLPMNPITGKRYKGINAIHLMAQGRNDARWMTYKQTAAVGAQVRKGEKGTPVQYWKFSEEQNKVDESGRPVRSATGEPVKEVVQLERPRVFFATVFNAEQIDGLPPIQRKEQTWNAVERAEHILKASGASITHAPGDRAFYRPATDSIHLPDRGQFARADDYYAIALHELGHWTGHSSRLDRDLTHPFGSEVYAKEELRAEIASMILGDELGIGHDPGQHAAYVGSWIKVLKDEPLEVFRAAAEAEKIHDYVLAFEQKQLQEQQPQHQMKQQKDAGMKTLEPAVSVVAQPPRQIVGNNPDGFVNQNAQGARDDSDRLGLTAEIEREFSTGKTVAQVITTLGDRLKTVPYEDRIGFISGVRATLGIPSMMDEDGKGEFREWREEYEKRIAVVGTPHLALKMGDKSDHSNDAQREDAKPDVGNMQTDDEIAEWAWQHIERGTLGRALERHGANLELIQRVSSVIEDMMPVNARNEFWTHREIPVNSKSVEQKIDDAFQFVFWQLEGDAKVAAARSHLIQHGESRDAMEAFSLASYSAFGFSLPHDWTGEVRIIGVIEGDGKTRAANLSDEKPDSYHLYARKSEAQFGEDAFVYLTAIPTLVEADEVADRLALIDANSQTDEFDKATRIARLQEDRVRRDPKSTDEDISAAKEARKTLEAEAFVASMGAQTPQKQRTAATAEQEQAHAMSGQAIEKQYIRVPFKEKDEAKQLGARWDRKGQSWYVPAGVTPALFAKWAHGVATEAVDARPSARTTMAQSDDQKAAQQARQYLAVPYEHRNAAKAAGAQWDKAAKSWYAGPHADMAKLEHWKPENVHAQQGPAMTPRDEFAEAMRSAGLLTGSNAQGDHPIMDGKRHRVPVEGGKKGALDGFYVGHLDGHPAGRIINNKTGTDITWKSKGYALSDQERAALQAEAAEKLAQRAAEQEQAQEATAYRVGRQMADLVPVKQPTPYLQAKGIEAHAGVFTDRDGQKTYIPAFDADGKRWTMQYIQEEGTKRFAKDSKKEGCFHPVGGMDALAAAPALVISEGYATAAQVAEAVGHATVAAFDSGNLEAVAKALHAKFPDKPVIIAGDDDRHLVMTHGNNPGREKAEAAAQAVGGKAIFPIFAPAENTYPRELPVITPDSFKAHLRAEQRFADVGTAELAGDEAAKLKASMLSGAQIEALSTMKQHTDFNDLAQKSELGIEGVKRQIGAAISQVQREQQHQGQKYIEKEQQQLERRPRHAARTG